MGGNRYTDVDVRVAKDAESETYDAGLGSDRIGTLAYQSAGGSVAMISITGEPEYQHDGVAGKLIAGALDDVADSGRTVTIICPVVRSLIGEHPEYARLVDASRRGIRSRSNALTPASNCA